MHFFTRAAFRFGTGLDIHSCGTTPGKKERKRIRTGLGWTGREDEERGRKEEGGRERGREGEREGEGEGEEDGEIEDMRKDLTFLPQPWGTAVSVISPTNVSFNQSMKTDKETAIQRVCCALTRHTHTHPTSKRHKTRRQNKDFFLLSFLQHQTQTTDNRGGVPRSPVGGLPRLLD